MALDKASLKTNIESLLSDMRTREENADSDLAQGLADLIDGYIKSAKITVSGIQTAGSSTAQSQTAPVDATIS